MVMDEAGRNGLKWHLAQQITYHVTLYIFQQITQLVIMRILSITTTSTTCNSIITQIWGDFYFSYKYQQIFPRIQL